MPPVSRSYASYTVTPFIPKRPPIGDLQVSFKAETLPVVVAGEGESGEMTALLDCMVMRESSGGKNLFGDNGKAFGPYQIHIDLHPVTYDCAMDFYCSRAYARKMIEAGQGFLWTSYYPCL